jgi:ABC-2 type transport system permease protein
MSSFDRLGADARIVDRSYRPYDGPRGGVLASMRSTTKHAVQRTLGIKRTIWQKVIPLFSIAIAYVPAIVIVGVSALFKDVEINDIPTYPEYYSFVTAAIMVFTSFVAPEVLCTDRRTGMLGLYLASPLDRNTYLLSKAAAVGFVLAIVTTGPLLLMLIAHTILGEGPENPGDWLLTLLRVLVSGLMISALHTSLSLAISSFTSRRAAASATIILLLFGSLIVGNILADPEGADWGANFVVFDLFTLPFAVVFHIFGQGSELGEPGDAFYEASPSVLVLAVLGWTMLFSVITWWRYRKITVTR